MIKNFIDFPVFLVSLAIGLLFVYLNESPKRVIYIYPTPNNVNKFIDCEATDNIREIDKVLIFFLIKFILLKREISLSLCKNGYCSSLSNNLVEPNI